jgi:hypothetical protein
MDWYCRNCFEWSVTVPCSECGAPKPAEIDELQKADDMLDRMRGHPKKRLRELAAACHLSYDDLMDGLRAYAAGHADYIGLSTDTPHGTTEGMWDDYELVTGEVVPSHKRYSPFSCSC